MSRAARPVSYTHLDVYKRQVGYLGNAATNVAFPLVTISLAFSLLIGDGCAAFFSLRLGAKDKESAAKGVGNAITLAVGFGVLFLVFGTLFMTPLLRLFGSTDTVLPYACLLYTSSAMPLFLTR